ncbi:cobalamin biosynthesis protein [Gordonia jinhuaensis]|uniref:cobalamin biosynthesis protein n=1 Tax=Gordonia jinhuaensis TaxID=1517702 RepID=UPI001E2FFDA7|nr:cobalamin biosynthesis protein [Gordonia jinhuaensis]
MRVARASGLIAGVGLDALLGDPTRFHPVAGMGRAAGALESVLYRDTRGAGVVYTVMCVGSAAALGAVASGWSVGGHTERSGAGRVRTPVGRAVREFTVTAAATWIVIGGRSLVRVGDGIAGLAEAGDLDSARELITHLCGRDPNSLDLPGLVRAACESVAENTSDAVVAPLVWGAVAGVPGLLGYRMLNTLDAMVGRRDQRYERFGWASARADDVANYVPARLSGAVVAVIGPDQRGAVRAWRAGARAHPSPNAGVIEAAFAGALGVRLGGRTEYRHGVEHRPVLGGAHAPAPTPADLYAAGVLSRRITVTAAMLAALLSVRTDRRVWRGHPRRGRTPARRDRWFRGTGTRRVRWSNWPRADRA